MIPCLVVGVVKGVGFLRVGRGELGGHGGGFGRGSLSSFSMTERVTFSHVALF